MPPETDRHAPFLGAFTPQCLEQLAHASPQEQERRVDELTRKTSVTAAVAAMQPLPIVDAVLLTPLQVRLVRSIAQIRGRSVEDADVKRMFRAVQMPILVAQAALAMVKLVQRVPWVPRVLAVSLAYSLTCAIGRVSDEYFVHSHADVEELATRVAEVSKRQFTGVVRSTRDELATIFREAAPRRRLKELLKARRDGTIDADEEAWRLEAILAGHERPQPGRT